MWLLHAALRRPITVMIAVVSIALCAVFALTRMHVDIFPNLNLPVLYVVQPYGGMDPTQVEGYLTDWYEQHFFYINGIASVESKCIENVALIKLTFHSGTDMPEAMSETVAEVERARAFMPPGTVGPFVLRFDAGSVPAGYLVMSSKTRSINQMQDLALTRLRPMFSALPGVSGSPAFGGNQRTIVVTVYPDRLNAYKMSAEEVVKAVAAGNVIIPNGDVRIGKLDRLGQFNAAVRDISELEMLPIRRGAGPAVYLRDVGKVADSSDIMTGYALVNGKRTVYLPVVKLANASTLTVVNEVKQNLGAFRHGLPADVDVNFEFDQSVYVTEAINNVVTEGIHGALLTGLMVLLFLRDIRSALIVLTSIPCAILSAIVLLWMSGQTINIMTLGGLALAIGILVDEATVTIENVHTHLAAGETLKRAVMNAGKETVTPRLLAMLSVISVFVPSFFLQGATKSLFVPLSLAVGFSMMASYVLSSSLVPVLSIWLLKPKHEAAGETGGASPAPTGESDDRRGGARPAPVESEQQGPFAKFKNRYSNLLQQLLTIRGIAVGAYALTAVGLIALIYPVLGTQIFPTVDTGQFEMRLRAPTGTRFEETEILTKKALAIIDREAGKGNVEISIGYVGTQPPAYAISNVYVFTSGPHEAVLTVALRPQAHIALESFKEKLRNVIPTEIPGTHVSFEAGDIISKIMNFGAPTPVQVAVSGLNLDADQEYANKLLKRMQKIAMLRDVQIDQPMDYPTVEFAVDRVRAGQLGVTMESIGHALVEITSSSRWIQQNYWRDPKTGVSYQVQVQVPQWHAADLQELQSMPVMPNHDSAPQVQDVANVSYASMPGEIDHYNQQRLLTVSANIQGDDLGKASRLVQQAIDQIGAPPRGVFVNIRGQVPPMQSTFMGLEVGLGLAVVVILLMLTANFQSVPLALTVLSVIPAILMGELVALFITRTTINVQSFMGAIMAIGVGTANSILLVTFAEGFRLKKRDARLAAIEAGRERLRPVLMTSIAMVAGMVPMAISADAQASLARAVIGGLLLSTPTVLIIVPLVFSMVREKAAVTSPSIHPDDDESAIEEIANESNLEIT